MISCQRAKPFVSASRWHGAKVRPCTTKASVEPLGLAFAGSMLLSPVLGTMYFAERKSRDELEAQIVSAQVELAAKDKELAALRARLAMLQNSQERITFLEKRLADADKEQLKLERALEMKDGQLESFMAVAQRQIKMLEERCIELQNWEPGI